MRRDSSRYGNFPKRQKSRERPWNRASPAFGKLWEHAGKCRVDLYEILMKSFIFALTKQDAFPETILFYNEGVKITTQESDTVNDLLFLDSVGVEIVNCGTCLDFFKLKDDLKVGSITNMYDIVERMEKAEKVIKPN